MMQSLCSTNKVKSLMSEVRDVKSEMSWAKVDSWSKAVVASLKKMEKDFDSFPDVVVPFSSSLAQVCRLILRCVCLSIIVGVAGSGWSQYIGYGRKV